MPKYLMTDLTDLDMHALQVTEQKPDKNIYEFDLTLWTFLCALAKRDPEKAHVQFSIPWMCLDAIATASENRLAQLASGVLISFKLQTDEKTVLSLLKGAYDPVITFYDTKGLEFDTVYWLLLKRVAQKDSLVAAAAFGLNPDLTLAVSEATDNQLRYMVTSTVTAFTLRFDHHLLLSLLTNDKRTVNPKLFYRKYQQTMSQDVKLRSGNE